MIWCDEDMIDYEGIQTTIDNNNLLTKKKIIKNISINCKNITIIKVNFKSKLLKLERFQEKDNKFTYLFHSLIEIDIFYLVNSCNSELESISEKIFDSYLVLNHPEYSENGEVLISEGYIQEYPDDGICVFIDLALILGGINYDN